APFATSGGKKTSSIKFFVALCLCGDVFHHEGTKSQRSENLPCLPENGIEHFLRKLSGQSVLLARGIRADHRDALGKRVHQAVSERRQWRRILPTEFPPRREVCLECHQP